MSTVSTIITALEYRIGSSIDSGTNPSFEQCLSQLNADIQWILGMCAECNSELGRTTGTITTVDGTAYYTTLASDMYTPSYYGWVEGTYSRDRIELTTEESSLDFSPHTSGEAQPTHFYVTAAGTVYLLPTPDAVYTVKIPYWQVQTALTAKTSTMPFAGLFDSILIESLHTRLLHKFEQDPSYEFKWFQNLTQRVRNLIEMRKNYHSSVTL